MTVSSVIPALPSYFHRLTDALEISANFPRTGSTAARCKETLGVSKTVAWRILRHCGGQEGPGGSLVCPRVDLIQASERLQQTGTYDHEIRRRDRLEIRLAELLTAARSRHIQVVPDSSADDLLSTRFGHLPAGMNLSPGRLVVDFAGIEEFLQKIGSIVFALQNDSIPYATSSKSAPLLRHPDIYRKPE